MCSLGSNQLTWFESDVWNFIDIFSLLNWKYLNYIFDGDDSIICQERYFIPKIVIYCENQTERIINRSVL